MPSAASVKVSALQDKEKDKDVKSLPFDPTEPFKQVATLVEHKIRNMEKRKAKLDSYKQEQENGKELNADQLSAVAKYDVLMHSLDFARDLCKQVLQIQTETNRSFKRQQKKEQAERALAETEFSKDLMTLTNWLHRYATLPNVRDDFINGRNGAFLLKDDEIEALDELSVVTYVGLGKDKAENDLGVATEHFANLADGKAKAIANTSTTYSHIKEILISMNDCDYNYTPVEPRPAMVDCQVATEPMETGCSVKDSAQILNPNAQYNFVEESQIDMVSPDMDPAIVVVSTSATPQIITQQLATMQKVIPQSSQIGTQPDVVRHENRLHGDQSLDTYNSSSGTDVDVVQSHLLQPQGAHIPDQVDIMNEWELKNAKYGSYGAKLVEAVDGNDFMANNFSTWEDPRSGEMTAHLNRGYRRGNGNFRPARFQQASSNGFQGRGAGSRYGGGSMNRWVAPQDASQQRPQFEEYRQGDRGEREREFKARGMGGGGARPQIRGLGTDPRLERNYFAGGPRNGAPRGSQGGWRPPYRGGYGQGGGSGDHGGNTI